MNSDFRELLQCFAKHRVRYLVVGGYAVIYYAQPRFTKDLDLWIEPSTVNARKVAVAFREFGIPLIEITEADLSQPGTQFMLGRAPVMFDFLTSIPPLEFAPCWERRKRVRHDFGRVNYLGLSDLRAAKTHANRAQDLADLEELNRLP
jgi:predicted nucleotidyltransferase